MLWKVSLSYWQTLVTKKNQWRHFKPSCKRNSDTVSWSNSDFIITAWGTSKIQQHSTRCWLSLQYCLHYRYTNIVNIVYRAQLHQKPFHCSQKSWKKPQNNRQYDKRVLDCYGVLPGWQAPCRRICFWNNINNIASVTADRTSPVLTLHHYFPKKVPMQDLTP